MFDFQPAAIAPRTQSPSGRTEMARHPLLGLVFAAALFTGLGTTACGGDDPATSGRVEAADGEGTRRATASSAAKSEFGVQRWESTTSEEALSVEGHDKGSRAVVEFKSTTTPIDDTHVTQRYDLRIPTGTWSVEVNVEDREDGTSVSEIASNTFTDDPAASRALDVIGNDLEARSSSTSLTASLNLRPLAPQLTCANFASCGQIVGYDTEAAKACAWAGAVTAVNPAAKDGAIAECNKRQDATRKLHKECGANFDGNHMVCIPRL